MDVAVREDQSQKRQGEAAYNLFLITKATLNLIKNHHPDEKGSSVAKEIWLPGIMITCWLSYKGLKYNATALILNISVVDFDKNHLTSGL